MFANMLFTGDLAFPNDVQIPYNKITIEAPGPIEWPGIGFDQNRNSLVIF
ncbi:unnamed protein product [Penicillium roqueforti FM164]|uniref:Uncharacterized protein n=1 Tax=Penicillium roqueforti (strain FM164) TaxID=1365484 RepID=W6QWK8_PENRF|nr:unnamed protein product [Penicillium roqueforti FM164]